LAFADRFRFFKLAHNVWQLKEVGGFHRDVFAIKNFLFTTNLSAEHIVANFF